MLNLALSLLDSWSSSSGGIGSVPANAGTLPANISDKLLVEPCTSKKTRQPDQVSLSYR